MLDAFIDFLFDEVLLIVVWMVPGYFVLQVWLLFRLHGGWRAAAMLPLIVLVPLLLHAGVALAMGSNLWPLFLVFFAPFGFLYLVAVWTVHGLRG